MKRLRVRRGCRSPDVPDRSADDAAPLADRVALVTGASRGAGKGIALALGAAGATVYLTGRSLRGGPTTLDRPGTIDETAEQVTALGGHGIAIRCDHFDDADAAAVFDRIGSDTGRLDVLVNNAWSGYEIPVHDNVPFWELEVRHWDLMFNSLRASMVAARHAVPLMLQRGGGLITNITWILATTYYGNAFYDTCKTANNHLTWAMSEELRPHGIAAVGVSPGWMACERMHLPPEVAQRAESTTFPGRGIVGLALDPGVLHLTGHVVTTPELARRYAFTDEDGREQSPFWDDFLTRNELRR